MSSAVSGSFACKNRPFQQKKQIFTSKIYAASLARSGSITSKIRQFHQQDQATSSARLSSIISKIQRLYQQSQTN
jgi:hypothetical protein